MKNYKEVKKIMLRIKKIKFNHQNNNQNIQKCNKNNFKIKN